MHFSISFQLLTRSKFCNGAVWILPRQSTQDIEKDKDETRFLVMHTVFSTNLQVKSEWQRRNCDHSHNPEGPEMLIEILVNKFTNLKLFEINK